MIAASTTWSPGIAGGLASDPSGESPLTEEALLAAVLRVETAWSETLVRLGLAPSQAAVRFESLMSGADLRQLASRMEWSADPVAELLALVRARAGDNAAATWLHYGLSSTDVLDTALMLCLTEVLDVVEEQLAIQAALVAEIALDHRDRQVVVRMPGLPATPTSLGLVAATWLSGLAAATAAVRRRSRSALPVQLGGVGGALGALVELARRKGLSDPAATALRAGTDLASALELAPGLPWLTNRTPVTQVAEALVAGGDAWGRIGGEIALLAESELLIEASTADVASRPGAAAQVLHDAVQIPRLAAELHVATLSTTSGSWQLEWDAISSLVWRAMLAGRQLTGLLAGLPWHLPHSAPPVRGATCADATEALLAEHLRRASEVWPELVTAPDH